VQRYIYAFNIKKNNLQSIINIDYKTDNQ